MEMENEAKTDLARTVQRTMRLIKERCAFHQVSVVEGIEISLLEIADAASVQDALRALEMETESSLLKVNLEKSVYEAERAMKEIEAQVILEIMAEIEGPDGQKGGRLSNDKKRDAEKKRQLMEDPNYAALSDGLTKSRMDRDQVDLRLNDMRRRREFFHRVTSIVTSIVDAVSRI